jgi:hypothetical protein
MFSQRSEEDDYEKPKENFLDDSGGSDAGRSLRAG